MLKSSGPVLPESSLLIMANAFLKSVSSSYSRDTLLILSERILIRMRWCG